MNADHRPIDEWSLEAACRGKGNSTWFPDVTTLTRTGRAAPPVPTAAAVVCERCPVQPECLAYALHHHVDGIWGGTNEQGRRNLRRAAGITATPLMPPAINPGNNADHHDPEERTAS